MTINGFALTRMSLDEIREIFDEGREEENEMDYFEESYYMGEFEADRPSRKRPNRPRQLFRQEFNRLPMGTFLIEHHRDRPGKVLRLVARNWPWFTYDVLNDEGAVIRNSGSCADRGIDVYDTGIWNQTNWLEVAPQHQHNWPIHVSNDLTGHWKVRTDTVAKEVAWQKEGF